MDFDKNGIVLPISVSDFFEMMFAQVRSANRFP